MFRVRPFAIAALLVAGWLALVAATSTGAEPSALSQERVPALVPASPEDGARATATFLAEGALAQYRVASLRFGVNVAALALFAVVALLRVQRGEGWRQLALPRWGRALLVLLAALQVLTNLNFVVRASPHGFHATDMFHYAYGSKYFPEVGYFDLYLCSAAAVLEPSGQSGAVVVRDLRSGLLERVPLRELPYDRCGGRFSAERWEAFRQDARGLRWLVGDSYWKRALRDHGYNPSPLWTVIGRPVASQLDVLDGGLQLAARFDWIFVAAAFGAAAWAFGLEVACLVALVWGGTGLNRYAWIGDSFLRQLWFGAAMAGICLLRRRRFAGAGALLAAAAGFRLFPAVYAGGALVSQALAAFGGSRRPLLRTAAGGLAALLVLGSAGVLASGRGPAVYAEFAHNIREFAATPAYNSVGLGPLVSYRASRPSAVDVDGERIPASDQRYPAALLAQTRGERWMLEWGAILAGLGLFAAAAWRLRGEPGSDWQLACAAFALVPLLSQPPCYYAALYAPAALLCVARPELRFVVLLALVGFSGAGLAFFNEREEYVAASAVAVALAISVLLALSRPPPGEREGRSEAAALSA